MDSHSFCRCRKTSECSRNSKVHVRHFQNTSTAMELEVTCLDISTRLDASLIKSDSGSCLIRHYESDLAPTLLSSVVLLFCCCSVVEFCC